jgi:hypothetical protein
MFGPLMNLYDNKVLSFPKGFKIIRVLEKLKKVVFVARRVHHLNKNMYEYAYFYCISYNMISIVFNCNSPGIFGTYNKTVDFKVHINYWNSQK